MLPDRIEFRHGGQKRPDLLGFPETEFMECVSPLGSSDKTSTSGSRRGGALGAAKTPMVSRVLHDKPRAMVQLIESDDLRSRDVAAEQFKGPELVRVYAMFRFQLCKRADNEERSRFDGLQDLSSWGARIVNRLKLRAPRLQRQRHGALHLRHCRRHVRMRVPNAGPKSGGGKQWSMVMLGREVLPSIVTETIFPFAKPPSELGTRWRYQ